MPTPHLMGEICMSGSMSGERKRSVAAWPKQPRLSSTLPEPDMADLSFDLLVGAGEERGWDRERTRAVLRLITSSNLVSAGWEGLAGAAPKNTDAAGFRGVRQPGEGVCAYL